jgi:hypothetical protein
MHRNPPGTHQDEIRDFRVLEPVPFFTGEAMRVRYPSFCHFIIASSPMEKSTGLKKSGLLHETTGTFPKKRTPVQTIAKNGDDRGCNIIWSGDYLCRCDGRDGAIAIRQ